MKYCCNYFDGMKTITQIMIPPLPFRRFIFYVLRFMFELGGNGNTIGIADNGNSFIEAYFYDDASRQTFCETVENAINVIQFMDKNTKMNENDIDEHTLDYFGIDAFESVEFFQTLTKSSKTFQNL